MISMQRTATVTCGSIVLLASLSCLSERSTGVENGGVACNVELPPEAAGSTIVTIRDFAFTPGNVRIRPGTKVTWVNCEPPGTDSHTSTADNDTWDSPFLSSGETFTFEFGAATGEFAYHCRPHPGMRGTVTVE